MDAKRRLHHLTRIAAAAAKGRRDLLRDWYPSALAEGMPAGDLHEATLQVFLFAGYPRTLDAFQELAPLAGGTTPPLEPDPGDLLARGRQFFDRIYGRHADTVAAKLEALHPDFARYVMTDAYGQVLARPFLPARERELMAVSMLAALGLRGQLQAHASGAVRVGATRDEVLDAVAVIEDLGSDPESARDLVTQVLSSG
jgi:alkylhydroperoxidase/carboxymuconolactone decarboxylase family protein YurZ